MDKRKKHYKETLANRKEIESWLKSKEKEFDEGFELLARFSHNRAMVAQVARKRRVAKIEYELQKIARRDFIRESRVWPIGVIKKSVARKDDNTEAEAVVKETGKKLVVTDEKINPDDLPDDLKKLYDENREQYKIMRALHEKMKLAKKDGERAELRAELVKLDDLITANWEKLDAWAENPEEPKEDAEKAADAAQDDGEKTEERKNEDNPAPEEVAKSLNACRSYLSRNVKKVAGLKGEKREQLLAKLAERVEILQKHNADIKDATRKELVELGLIDGPAKKEDSGNE